MIGLDPTTHEYTTISEFPFFTFFQADLHPHLLAFPYFIAAFAVGHRFLVAGPTAGPEQESAPSARSPGWTRWMPALFFAFAGGTAIAANLWTIPAIGILMVVVCALRKTRGRELPRAGDAALGALGGLLLLLLAYELWWSYEASFSLTSQNPKDHGIAWNTMTSGLFEFLGVWGLFLAAGLAAAWPAQWDRDETAIRRRDLWVATTAAAAVVAGLWTGAPALVLLVPPFLLSAVIAWRALRRTHDADDLFAAFLLLLGLGMVGGCEFVHFKDSYGDRMQRMNTIFKFYNQAWPLLAIAVAVFAQKAWSRGQGARRIALGAVLGACAAAALLYPAAAILQRLGQHEGPFTLDARPALVRRNPADAAAIAWLERNVHGGTVVLEATGDAYSEYSRIATHTGIPTVMGWANHEGLWRENDKEIAERVGLVRAFYTVRDPNLASQILQRYHVTHVVVGDLESRIYPGAEAVAGYSFLDPVFSGQTTVFRVATPAPAP